MSQHMLQDTTGYETYFAVCNRAHPESTTLLVANHRKSVSPQAGTLLNDLGFPDPGRIVEIRLRCPQIEAFPGFTAVALPCIACMPGSDI